MNLYIPNPQDTNPTIHQELLRKFKTVIEALHPAFSIIYYPCCGTDTTLSAAFPNAQIIYVDLSQLCIDSLRSHGLHARCLDVTSFRPTDEVDALVMINPALSPEKLLWVLRPGGYLFCNDYHRTARFVREQPGFTLLGAVAYAKNETMFDTTNLADFWTTVQTDEELAFVPHAAERIRRFVERFGSTEHGVLAGYAALRAKAYQAEWDRAAQMAQECPDLCDPPKEGEDFGALFLNPKETETLLPLLPARKGDADTLFVFQKNEA